MKTEHCARPPAKPFFESLRFTFTADPAIYSSLSPEDRLIIANFIQNIKRVTRWLKGSSFVFAVIGEFGFLIRAEACDSRISHILRSLTRDAELLSRYRIRRHLKGDVCAELSVIDTLVSDLAESMVGIIHMLDPERVGDVGPALDAIERGLTTIENNFSKRSDLIERPMSMIVL